MAAFVNGDSKESRSGIAYALMRFEEATAHYRLPLSFEGNFLHVWTYGHILLYDASLFPYFVDYVILKLGKWEFLNLNLLI